LLLALLASPAAAGPDHDVPGTGGDPIVALTLLPEVVDAPLFPGLSVRGDDPANTKVLFDGFELPVLFHDDRALRSTIIANAFSNIAIDRDEVELGRGTSFVTLTPSTTSRLAVVQGSDFDATVATPLNNPPLILPGYAAARFNYSFDELESLEETAAFLRTHGHWKDSLSVFATVDELHGFVGRLVARTRYSQGGWHVAGAVSPVFGNATGVGTRAEVGRIGAGAGLQFLEWRAGIESRHEELGGTWVNDVAAWSSLRAKLSANIVANGGVRIDAFLRGEDIATQPRGSLQWRDDNSNVKLEAGAFRRPPEKPAELAFEFLHPERTTQIVATVQHNFHADKDSLLGAELAGFYIDRTHLVARDSAGNWGNTGTGTSKGVELKALFIEGAWQALLGASLSSSLRRDYPRGRERSADFDQPVRIDALVRYARKRWRVGARFSLSSGLPYTPIVESTYDSDADSYEPELAFTNSGRLPWMHGLDVRADVYLGRGFIAFAELRNAYAASTALRYEYSYDYKQRLAVTLPILPYVGISYTIRVPRYRRPRPTPVIAEASP
jgi:hypothetical protein